MRLYDRIRENIADAVAMSPICAVRVPARALGRHRMRLRVRGAGIIEFRLRTTDIMVLRQIFVDRQYDLSRFAQFATVMAAYRLILDRGKVPVVVDGGANIGASAIWFARMFPAAGVVAVEPDPANAALCRRNTAALANITVLEAALGSVPGRAEIRDPSANCWAFEVARTDGGTIPIVSVPQAIDQVPNGCAFAVKLDIEGFESELFSANTGWLGAISLLMLEPHDWKLTGAKSSRSFQQAVARHDFDILISGEHLVYVHPG